MNSQKKFVAVAALAAVGLVGCTVPGQTTSQTTSQTSDVTSSSTSSSSTSSSSTVDHTPVYQDLLNALQADEVATTGDFSISFYHAGTDQLINTAKSTNVLAIGEDYYMNAMLENSVTTGYSEYYKNKDGNVVTKALLPNNTVRETLLVDKAENPLVYDDYFYNFFDVITLNDLEMAEDGKTVLATGLDRTDQYEIVYGLTYYKDIPMLGLGFQKVDNYWIGALTGGEENVPVKFEDGTTINVDMTCEMSFVITTPSDIGFTPIAPFATDENCPPLQQLFKSLQAGNYTVDIVRTGGLDQGGHPQTWYLNDTSIVRMSHDKETKEVINGLGLIQTEGGIDQVSYEKGKLVGSPELDEGNIADYKVPFLFAAEAFAYKDGVYHLKTGYGFESLVNLTLPDAVMGWNQQYYYNIDDGSLAITLTNDGAIFYYTYSYLDYGNEVTGTITATVSNIGKTEVPYEYEPYVAPDFSSWTAYGEENIALLYTYLGNDLTLLPTFDLSLCKSYKATDTSNYTGHYLRFTNTYSDADVGAAAYDAFIAGLLEKGWTKDPHPEYTDGMGRYHHKNDDGTYYHLAITKASNGKTVNLTIYQPSVSLDTWYNNSFKDQYAGWLTYETKVQTFAVDEAGEKTGDALTTTTNKIIHKFKDGAMQETINNKVSTYFVEDTANNKFVILKQGSDNKWAPVTSYDDLTQWNITSYVASGMYVTPQTLLPYFTDTSLFTPVEGDGVYQMDQAQVAPLTKQLFGVDLSANATGILRINWYDNEIKLTITDSVVKDGTLTETTCSLLVNRVGLQTSFTTPQFSYE